MKRTISLVLIGLFLFHQGLPLAYGQETSAAIRNIRVKKLAQQWKGQTISFYWTNNQWVTGKLVDVTTRDFIIDTGGKLVNYQHQSISAVTFPPGMLELFLTVVTGLLTAGLGWGAVALSSPDAKEVYQGGGAFIGFGIGLYGGYKAFYQKVVVELD